MRGVRKVRGLTQLTMR